MYQSNTETIEPLICNPCNRRNTGAAILHSPSFCKKENCAALPKESERFIDFSRLKPEFRAISIGNRIAAERYQGEAGKVSVKGMVTIRYV